MCRADPEKLSFAIQTVNESYQALFYLRLVSQLRNCLSRGGRFVDSASSHPESILCLLVASACLICCHFCFRPGLGRPEKGMVWDAVCGVVRPATHGTFPQVQRQSPGPCECVQRDARPLTLRNLYFLGPWNGGIQTSLLFCQVHPNPSRDPHLKLKYYEFAGKVVGKCLYESALGGTYRQLVKARFTRSFLAQLIGLRVNYRVSSGQVLISFDDCDPKVTVARLAVILSDFGSW